jgi:hypothetical protein
MISIHTKTEIVSYYAIFIYVHSVKVFAQSYLIIQP